MLLGGTQDPILLRWMDAGRRYFSTAASTTLVLGVASIMALLRGLGPQSLAGWLGQVTCLVLAISLHYIGLQVSQLMHLDV